MGTRIDRDAFSVYRTQLGNQTTLTPDVERDLSLRWRQGDRDAGRRLTEACLPFVMIVAREYRRWGLPLEDIVQEGNIGLLKAVDRFDPDRGCRLTTYAGYWIRAEIREYVARGYRLVRLGASKSERRALRIYRKTLERDPSVLAELSGMSEARATELLPLLMAREVSIDGSAGADDSLTPADRLASPDRSPEEETCIADEQDRLSRVIKKAMRNLSPREKRIMKQRWLTENPKTLAQVGAVLGVSKERVRQIEEGAKKHIRAYLEETRQVPPLAKSA